MGKFWEFVDSGVVSGIPSKEGGRIMSYLGTVVTTTPALYWRLQYKRTTEIQKYKREEQERGYNVFWELLWPLSSAGC